MDHDRLLVSAINVSEGRRTGVVDRIAQSVLGGAKVLDVHSDPDHNRSVLTIAGPPTDIEFAVGEIAKACVSLIDIRHHEGVHPWLGAIDVVPLVPVRALSLPDAITSARAVATRLANDLDLPCFLYELASEDRRNLPEVRRLAFKSLPPDLGPQDPHPTAGATSVGARGPLVAFNVELESNDLYLAKRIARSLRNAEGGLGGIRSLAFPLATKRCVQVSMNLVEPLVTTVALALAEVTRFALAEGVRVRSAELVGLAPEGALVGLRPGVLGQDRHPSMEKALERAFGQAEVSGS